MHTMANQDYLQDAPILFDKVYNLIKIIFPMIRLQEYQPGDIVLPAGELGKGFCILESGVLEVVRDSKVLSEIDMAGSIFGELRKFWDSKGMQTLWPKPRPKFDMWKKASPTLSGKTPRLRLN